MTNKQAMEREFECPYSAECILTIGTCSESCFVRQLFEERNQAENKVKQLEEENKILRGWRQISHKKINKLSKKVISYITHTNKLTSSVNELKSYEKQRMCDPTIIVLKPDAEYTAYFSLNKFDNIKDAMQFVKDTCYDDLKDFKFFEATELELNLTFKEAKNDK